MSDNEWALHTRLIENFRDKMDENERLAKIDWDQVRVDAAIAAMQGLCNSCHDSVIREIQERLDKERSSVISFLAVRIADSLIIELRKEEAK